MNNKQHHRWLPAVLSLMTAAAVLLVITQGIGRRIAPAAAGSPPPARPAFQGEPYEAAMENSELDKRPALIPAVAGGGWNSVFTETFESGISPLYWTTFDADGVVNGEYKWGTETYTNTTPGGVRSAWAVGDGEQGGALNPASDGYPPDADSWLVYGPVDLSSAIAATILFDYWLESSPGDSFAVLVSTDGANWSGLLNTSGGSANWSGVMYNLDSYAGESSVSIAFVFASDDTANPGALKGAFVDQVILMLEYPLTIYLPYIQKAPTPTPTNTPTPPPTPTPTATATAVPSIYVDNFDNPNSGWSIRRQNTDAPDNAVRYVTGMLEVEVRKGNDYAIVSPLVAAATGDYRFETQAQFINPQDQHGYGMVFAGDWNGTTCPNSSYNSCFNHYYWMEVRWLAGGGNPLLVFRLRRIDSHSGADNTPVGVTLINWTEVRNVNGVPVPPGGINEWDVVHETDGDIRIYVNNQQAGTFRDTTYVSNRYFGLTTSTINDAGPSNPNAKVQFQYVSVVPVQ